MQLLKVYQNLKFDDPTLTLEIIIWGIFVGLCLGCLISYYNKIYLGKIVRILSREEAFSKNEALTFESMGLKPNIFYRRALRDDTAMRKYVAIANVDECLMEVKESKFGHIMRMIFFHQKTLPNKYDFSKAEFYLLPDVRYTAEVRYEKKGNELFKMLILIILTLAVAVALTLVIPFLLGLIDDVITMYKEL